jgi:hypothetical protein
MEHRHDLAEILLSGLPEDERTHVVRVINEVDAEKLRHKRAQSAAEGDVLEVTDSDLDDSDDDDAGTGLIGRVPSQG